MQFGISTHLLKEDRIVDALAFIARTGFGAAEVWASDLLNTGESPADISRFAQKYNLRLSLHAQAIEIDPSNPEAIEKSLKRIFKAIRVAGQIGANPVVFHPARRRPEAYDSINYWQGMETALRRINDQARSLGIMAALEAMDGDKPAEVIIRPEDISSVMAFDLPNVRICLDMAHVRSVMNPVEYLDRIDPSWLHHVHLSDRSAKQRHLPLGRGTLPIQDVLERLNRFYKGLVIIEGRLKGRGKEVVQANFRYLQRRGWMTYSK